MGKYAKTHERLFLVIFLTFALLLTGCVKANDFSNEQEKNDTARENTMTETTQPDASVQGAGTGNDSGQEAGTGGNSGQEADTGNGSTEPEPIEPQIDYEKVKPNEAGKIMVVMFHNFVESYKSGDTEYTTTFSAFRELLQTLYDKGYRLISMSDYLNNNISVPAGCIPMIFTFDDGTPGQFNLVEENGKLVVNPRSAVGIMEEFNRTHPDFGLKGTFYVNLGLGTFQGKGTLAERLKYLIDKGFEIGNHTLNHANLSEIKTAEEMMKEIGGNQKKMYELVPDYKMISFSLPYGVPSKELKQYVVKGEYEGVGYEHLAIVEVGWDPAPSPVSVNFNPLSTHRVRASGIEPVQADLEWWLKNLSREEQYVSDGNPDTVTVPKEKEDSVDKNRLNGKKLITY